MRYSQRTVEGLDGEMVMADLGVQHPQIHTHPRNSFDVTSSLECTEAGGITRLGGDEVAAHVEEHATILLDHSQQANIACSAREFGGLGIESLALGKVAASLRDDGQAVESVGFGAH